MIEDRPPWEALERRGPLRLPPPVAIARRLVDGWLAGECARP